MGITDLAEAAPSTSRTLEASFKNPPDSARIWVYWFWLNGNITRGGITADLEAMKRAGVGGVLIMEVDQGTPVGPVAFMSDRWRELFKHMVAEAHRLGIEVNMNNDAGWNGSGGPWVPLDQAMQVIVNGKNLGILWKAPYSVDITDSVKAGENDLEIRVVNLPELSGKPSEAVDGSPVRKNISASPAAWLKFDEGLRTRAAAEKQKTEESVGGTVCTISGNKALSA